MNPYGSLIVVIIQNRLYFIAKVKEKGDGASFIHFDAFSIVVESFGKPPDKTPYDATPKHAPTNARFYMATLH